MVAVWEWICWWINCLENIEISHRKVTVDSDGAGGFLSDAEITAGTIEMLLEMHV